MDWKEFGATAAAPVVVASLAPLAVEGAQYYEATFLEQLFVVILLVAVALWVQWKLMTLRQHGSQRAAKREAIKAVLDAVVTKSAGGSHPLDRCGDLNLRLNVMVPYRRRRFGFRYVPDRPAHKGPDPDVVFHMVACSSNSAGRPSLWAGWHAGQGCVGMLCGIQGHLASPCRDVTPYCPLPPGGLRNSTPGRSAKSASEVTSAASQRRAVAYTTASAMASPC